MKSKRVTSAHVKKLHTILGKLEALENQLPDKSRAAYQMGVAKSELMRALWTLESELEDQS